MSYKPALKFNGHFNRKFKKETVYKSYEFIKFVYIFLLLGQTKIFQFCQNFTFCIVYDKQNK